MLLMRGSCGPFSSVLCCCISPTKEAAYSTGTVKHQPLENVKPGSASMPESSLSEKEQEPGLRHLSERLKEKQNKNSKTPQQSASIPLHTLSLCNFLPHQTGSDRRLRLLGVEHGLLGSSPPLSFGDTGTSVGSAWLGEVQVFPP